MSNVILIAGGSGFIGSNLAKLLVQEGNKVICLDNLHTGNKRNNKQLLNIANFTFIEDDVCNDRIITILNDKQINQIYHLASPASITYITKHPVEAALANSLGTQNLLKLAHLKKARLVFASSSEVYGDPKKHPQKENYWGNVNPVGVRSGYDEGKRFGEALCMAYKREFGVSIGIARIFNTYGPNSSENDSRVIPRFIVQALRNKDLTVHGHGTQTRSFCYVDDLVLGLKKIMESTSSGPFNLGNPREYKITEVANIILNLTGSKGKIKFTKRPPDDPQVRKPDIFNAKKNLNWTPRVEFKNGLVSTIKYFKELLLV